MKILDQTLLDDLVAAAAAAPRRRRNHNLHPVPEDPVQRLFNAIEPGSYIRPHRHPARWELFAVVRGALVLLTFAPDGRVLERLELGPGRPAFGAELPPGTWHALAALEPASVMLEIKQGPYLPVPAEDFAPWAPAEGEAGADAFAAWYTGAAPGDLPTP